MSQNFLQLVYEKAKTAPAKIVFPETFDERTLEAVKLIAEGGYAKPILIGDRKKLENDCRKLGLAHNMDSCEFIDMEKDSERREKYAAALFEQRKSKGMTMEVARKLMTDLNYFSVMALKMNEADALISGANCPTSDTLRPALQIISTKEKFHKVSGFFFMVLENRLLMFADCMVNIDPNSHDIAEIAIDTAETAKRFGMDPRIALLSFSTNGSAKHPSVDKMREALALIRDKRPDLVCEGEMQVDAALVPEVCAKKFPKSRVPGNANILIFPDLNSANISYKLVERLGGAKAIGPVLQGLLKPVNDLSRGCSVKDIVRLAAITSVETQETFMDTCGITCIE